MNKKKYDIEVNTISQYIQDQSYPEYHQYVFAYTITITNKGTISATLLRRYWLITDANNKIQEVRGDGVVGQQCTLLPNQSFEYTSIAMLATPVGCMQGHYEMIGGDGVEFNANIPVFNLSIPNILQ